MKILKHLPIPTAETLAFVGRESVRLKEAEIIVWLSVSAWNTVEWNPALPRFPTILDTGNTHNFAIQEQHMVRWAGIRPETLRFSGTSAIPASGFPFIRPGSGCTTTSQGRWR